MTVTIEIPAITYHKIKDASERLAWLEANCSMIQLRRAAGSVHSEGWSKQFSHLTLSEWIEKEMKK